MHVFGVERHVGMLCLLTFFSMIIIKLIIKSVSKHLLVGCWLVVGWLLVGCWLVSNSF
jgi:hypothetical protein